jgi:YVTN family beta-propeller protein
VIDTATDTVVATIPVGNYPFGVGIHPAGTFVYVSNVDSDNVSVIDTTTNTVTSTIPVGQGPIAIGFFIGPLDTDNDGTPDKLDGCPNDPDKIDPGTCGCGEPDTDACNVVDPSGPANNHSGSGCFLKSISE